MRNNKWNGWPDPPYVDVPNSNFFVYHGDPVRTSIRTEVRFEHGPAQKPGSDQWSGWPGPPVDKHGFRIKRDIIDAEFEMLTRRPS